MTQLRPEQGSAACGRGFPSLSKEGNFSAEFRNRNYLVRRAIEDHGLIRYIGTGNLDGVGMVPGWIGDAFGMRTSPCGRLPGVGNLKLGGFRAAWRGDG